MVKEKKRASRQSKASRQSVVKHIPVVQLVEPAVPLAVPFANEHNTLNKHVSFNRNAVSQNDLHPMGNKSDGYRLLEKVGPDPTAIFPEDESKSWYGPEHKKVQQLEMSLSPTNPNNRSFRGRHYLSRRRSIKEANTLFKTNNPEKNKRWWWWFGRGITKKRGKSKSKRRRRLKVLTT